MSEGERLAVHGFVLAGGKSSRMGRDKALLSFGKDTMIAIALRKLQCICETVGISGSREDLRQLAPVTLEEQTDFGPAAGISAALRASGHAWTLFVPVDVPLFPELLLSRWVTTVISREAEGIRLSYLLVQGERQPAFCLLHEQCTVAVTNATRVGERKLETLFQRVASTLGPGTLWVAEALDYLRPDETADLELLFRNVNTPEDLFILGKEASLLGMIA